MANPIVQVNVSVTTAPTPSRLQATGAIISQGGTNTGAGTKSLLTQRSDLTALLNVSVALVSLAWASDDGGTVTGSTASAHNIAVGQEFTISGCTPAAYNGTFVAVAGTTGSVLKYALADDPGAATVLGTMINSDVAELTAQVTSFFAQGTSRAVYVLELGPGSPADGVDALTTYIDENPGVFYSYLVRRAWDAVADFITMLGDFNVATSKTYFFITSTVDTYDSYAATLKCAFVWIDSPDAPSTEFGCAAAFQRTLSYQPSATNKVTPTAFAFLFGVTSYPTSGNGPLFTALKAAGVNYAGTGAEGGLSNVILLWGTTKDGNDFSYWYSVDWVQIECDRALAAAVINGSNNPINPLYYNQNGVNRLQNVVNATMASGVSFGLVLFGPQQVALTADQLQSALDDGTFDGITVVNAIPFLAYVTDHPSDYQQGLYGGLTVVYTPQLGFKQIVFNVNVSQLPLG